MNWIHSIDLLLQNNILRYTIAITVGLCIGSFLNVVIVRLPLILKVKWLLQSVDLIQNELRNAHIVEQLLEHIPMLRKLSLAFPASHCPNCFKSLKWWMNLPVISYILLKAKCYFCKEEINSVYPIIELLTAVLFCSIAIIYQDLWHLLAYATFVSIIIVAAVIDYQTLYLPDELTLPFLWLGLLININGFLSGSVVNSILGAITGYLFLGIIYFLFKVLTKKEGMGFGDFKFFAALGAWLGVSYIIPIALISSIAAIIFAVISFLLKQKKLTEAIPFGPFLGIGAISCVLFSNYIQPNIFI